MIEADIQIQAEGWPALVADTQAAVRRAVDAVSARSRGSTIQEISIVLSDDARVRDLNRRFRGQDKATNVLAFPPPAVTAAGGPADAKSWLGDVVLALETVKREAEAQNKPVANHMSHLIIHGTLHLLGYDHDNDREAARMEAEEIAILDRLGIPDPYLNTVEEAEAAPDG